MIKRKIYFINTKYQLKFLWPALLSSILSAAFVYGLIYYYVLHWISVPEIFVNNFLMPLKKVNIILLIVAPIAIGGLTFWVVRISHTIAGPLYRIEKELDNIISSRVFSKRIKIRRKDELHPLVERLNRLLESVDKK